MARFSDNDWPESPVDQEVAYLPNTPTEFDKEIEQALDAIYAAGCLVTELHSEGLSSGSITSDRYLEAKNAMKQVVDKQALEARLELHRELSQRPTKVWQNELYKMDLEKLEVLKGNSL